MTTKTKIIIAAVAVLTAFAFGRYSAPEKIKVEKVIVEVEKKKETVNTDVERSKHKETKVVEVIKPDGTKETTTTTTEDTKTDKKTDKQSDSESTNTTTEKKEVTASSQKTTIAFMAGTRLSLSSETTFVGAQVYKPIIGPIGIGVWGLTNATVGVSIGFSF